MVIPCNTEATELVLLEATISWSLCCGLTPEDSLIAVAVAHMVLA